MMSDAAFWGLAFAVLAITLASIFGIGAILGNMECEAKTGRIGKASDWSLIGGCMVEETPGTWIPLDNYRVIDS